MPLKMILDTLEGLDDSLKPLYEKGSDEKFKLKSDYLPEGFEDVSGLKANRDKVLDEKKKLQERLDALDSEKKKAEEEAEAARLEAAKKNGDSATLEKSYQEKIEKIQGEFTTKLAALETEIYGLTVGSEASRIASKLAAKPEYIEGIKPWIEQRIKSEVVDGKRIIRVLDDTGSATAMTPDELLEKAKTVPYLMPLISGTGASGGGGTGGGGGAPPAKGLYRSKMSPADKAQFIEKNGQEAYLALPKEPEK